MIAKYTVSIENFLICVMTMDVMDVLKSYSDRVCAKVDTHPPGRVKVRTASNSVDISVKSLEATAMVIQMIS